MYGILAAIATCDRMGGTGILDNTALALPEVHITHSSPEVPNPIPNNRFLSLTGTSFENSYRIGLVVFSKTACTSINAAFRYMSPVMISHDAESRGLANTTLICLYIIPKQIACSWIIAQWHRVDSRACAIRPVDRSTLGKPHIQ